MQVEFLYRPYSISFNSSNVGKFSKGQYRGSPGKDTESGCLVFTSSSKRKIGHFDVVVMQRRQRNEEKKRYARAILSLFCQSKPIAFFAVLVG